MYNGKQMVSVVITAAGKGTRMGMAQNKQYVEVLGKPVLARTLEVFDNCSMVDELIITVNRDDIDYCKKNILKKFGFRKVTAVIAGGASRQQSVYKGLQHVSAGCCIVLIHDGARPFIDEESIKACISEAAEIGAACSAVPVKDTIKRVDIEGFVDETVDREKLWTIQTPQAFQYKIILEAHSKAISDGYEGTDDAVLAERSGHKVKLVMGTYYNIKITTKEDLTIAEAIINIKRRNNAEREGTEG